MNLLREIQTGYDFLPRTKIKPIENLPEECPAFLLKRNGSFGIAVPCDDHVLVSEHFASCDFISEEILIGGSNQNCLMLLSSNLSTQHEFSVLCAHFVDPGENHTNRRKLLEKPLDWWNQWSRLLGNSVSAKKAYDVVAELCVLASVYKDDKATQWMASIQGSVDIESSSAGFEVKSTIARYGSLVTISGQFQLESDSLSLVFCRMEESPKGISINDAVNKLSKMGYDKNALDERLAKMGFERGASARTKKFKILESRKYRIDEKFPRITPESFKKGRMPDSIVHIVYDIDLDCLPYEPFDL